jgi:hypothetical protein
LSGGQSKLKLSGNGQGNLKLSGNGNECKPLAHGRDEKELSPATEAMRAEAQLTRTLQAEAAAAELKARNAVVRFRLAEAVGL